MNPVIIVLIIVGVLAVGGVIAGVVVSVVAVAGTAAVVNEAWDEGMKTGTVAYADEIRRQSTLYYTDHSACPDLDDLEREYFLYNTRDMWGHKFTIECDGSNIVVTSPGPDGDFDTSDDVVVD